MEPAMKKKVLSDEAMWYKSLDLAEKGKLLSHRAEWYKSLDPKEKEKLLSKSIGSAEKQNLSSSGAIWYKSLDTAQKQKTAEWFNSLDSAQKQKRAEWYKENEEKIKELEDKLLYQEVYNRRENLRFFGIPESTTGVENTLEVMRNFLKEELELGDSKNIEFQRVHRIGKKKTGEARPVIVRFLKFPERELVFRKAREMESDIDVKIYSEKSVKEEKGNDQG